MEHERGAVVGRVAGGQDALRHQALVVRSSGRLAVVVRGVAAGHEAEPAGQRGQALPERIGRPGLEPAQRPGRLPGHHGPRFPGTPQRPVDAVDAPDREHVLRVAAADVDDVLLAQEGIDVVDGPVEQREVARLRAAREGVVEAGDIGRRLTAGRRQEADPRPIPPRGRPGERQDVLVERVGSNPPPPIATTVGTLTGRPPGSRCACRRRSADPRNACRRIGRRTRCCPTSRPSRP